MAPGAINSTPPAAAVCGADQSCAASLPVGASMAAGASMTGEHDAAGTDGTHLPHADALMVALILAPDTFSRNKFFRFYEDRKIWSARRRAQMVRSLIKELTEPWPVAGQVPARAPAVIEQ
ncbi:MAG TPA: hypothetical protein VN764_18445, partial [Polyangiaceae bacterium]|nr:hypothetical protein [Polyangiaceae bacterium]